LALLACLAAAPPARADIPWLSIRLVGGEMANYPVNELNRIGFDGDTLVVVHAGGTERYGAAEITRIAFDLPKAGPVELVIYSVNGRLIRRLVKESRVAGRHTASWDGRDDAGEKVGSGIYFYQLTAPGVEESRRMILLP
jgi:flagellar hook assembly protein FlgD